MNKPKSIAFPFRSNSHNTLATRIPHQRVSAALNNRRIGRSSLRTEARATTNYDYAGLNAAPTELTGKVEVPVRPPAPVTRTVGRGAVESAMTSCSRRLGSCRIPLSFGAVDNRSGRWVWEPSRRSCRSGGSRGAEGVHVTPLSLRAERLRMRMPKGPNPTRAGPTM